ncbi:phage anti-RecBCD protein, partial [Shigella boydii]
CLKKEQMVVSAIASTPQIDKFPEYIDPRLRNYRSRYGAISND